MIRRFAPRLLALAMTAALAAPALAAGDGDIDTTFAAQGFRSIPFDFGTDNADVPEALVPLADGGYLAVGRAKTAAGTTVAVAARLTAAGVLDNGFGTGGKFRLSFGGASLDNNDSAFLGATQLVDGRLAMVGFFDVPTAPPQTHKGLLVVHDGATTADDIAYSASAGVTSEYTGAAVNTGEALGRVTMTGLYQDAGTSQDFFAQRYFPSFESFDGGFGDQARRITNIDLGADSDTDASTAIVQLPDGGVLQAGFAQVSGTDYDFAVVRLDASGDVVTKRRYFFDQAGSSKNDRARAMAIDSQGRIVIAGEVARSAGGNDTDIGLVRLEPDLDLDSTFANNGKLVLSFDPTNVGARDELGGIAIMPDDRIVIVGTHFTGDAANITDVGVARIAADGDIDEFFGVLGRELYDFGSGTQQKDVGVDVVLRDGRAVVLSQREFSGADTDFVAFGVVNRAPDVFATSFE